MVASLLLRLIARITAFNIRNWSLRPVQTQEKQFKHLIDSAKKDFFWLLTIIFKKSPHTKIL